MSHTDGKSDGESNGVEFAGLILGFSSAALYYLGEVGLENKGPPAKNLPLAKQNIDILRLLQVKTKGNLVEDEARLLTQIISDLQLKYVAANR